MAPGPESAGIRLGIVCDGCVWFGDDGGGCGGGRPANCELLDGRRSGGVWFVLVEIARIVHQTPIWAVIACRVFTIGCVLEGGIGWRVERSEFRRVWGVRWISCRWASVVWRCSVGVVIGGVLRGNL